MRGEIVAKKVCKEQLSIFDIQLPPNDFEAIETEIKAKEQQPKATPPKVGV